MKTNDGGPAFPKTGFSEISAQKGMTLRDYFAAQVLPAIWAESAAEIDSGDRLTMTEMAEEAYRMAGEMIAERAKP